MNALILFACTFGVVLALSLQSLNVVQGHKVLAAITSFAIGAFNLVLFKLVPQPTGTVDLIGYLIGGPCGVLAAMRFHPLLVRLAARLGGGAKE